MVDDYDTRYRRILDGLTALHSHPDLTPNLPVGLADQLEAAARDTANETHRFATHHRIGGLAQYDNPETALDFQARVYAAMEDGEWTACPHIQRTPAQPTYVLLPARSLVCGACVHTAPTPPADEADRCDLCGTRDVTAFLPLLAASLHWLIVGDICETCAQATHVIGNTP